MPGIYETVERAERVKVRALDQNGNAFTLEREGLLAVCIQHEMDHLEGKVFVEYLSQLKQQRIRRGSQSSCARPPEPLPPSVAPARAAMRLVFAGTPAFAARALAACGRRPRDRAGAHAARPAAGRGLRRRRARSSRLAARLGIAGLAAGERSRTPQAQRELRGRDPTCSSSPPMG